VVLSWNWKGGGERCQVRVPRRRSSG
jgi:hypothetical protein